MLDRILGYLAARMWRWWIRKSPEKYYHILPGDCMYCGYTLWANRERGQNLKIEQHDCVEGNGGPKKLTAARLLK